MVSAPVKKKHIRWDTLVSWTLPSIYQYQIFEKYKKKKKEWTEAVKNLKYYINTQQQIPVPYGSMLHIPLTN